MESVKYLIRLVLGSVLLLSYTMIQSQTLSTKVDVYKKGASASASDSIEIQSKTLFLEVLENFEDAEDWTASSTSPLEETETLKLVQRGEIRSTQENNGIGAKSEVYSTLQNSDKPNHIMGVKGYFELRGFDRIEVKPPHEYQIRGKARQFSLWVLGRNFRHTLYIKVRDGRGSLHKLRLGRLNFYGWRKLSVVVPGWLSQSTHSHLINRNLHFVSLFVVSDVHEPGGSYYFYIDDLKVLVDRSEQMYPGVEIRDNW